MEKKKWTAIGYYGKNILAIRCRNCGRIVAYPKLQNLYEFCPGCGYPMYTLDGYIDKIDPTYRINPEVYTDQTHPDNDIGMNLIDFLKYRTSTNEICAIKVDGYITCMVYIDREDLFVSSIHPNLRNENVKIHYYGDMDATVASEESPRSVKIKVHFVEV